MHKNKVHEGTPVACPTCDFIPKDQQNLYQHLKEVNGAYDNLHEDDIWLNGKSDKLTRHTDYFRFNYTVLPSSSLLWLIMTRHYRHGIWILRKISQTFFYYVDRTSPPVSPPV